MRKLRFDDSRSALILAHLSSDLKNKCFAILETDSLDIAVF